LISEIDQRSANVPDLSVGSAVVAFNTANTLATMAFCTAYRLSSVLCSRADIVPCVCLQGQPGVLEAAESKRKVYTKVLDIPTRYGYTDVAHLSISANV